MTFDHNALVVMRLGDAKLSIDVTFVDGDHGHYEMPADHGTWLTMLYGEHLRTVTVTVDDCLRGNRAVGGCAIYWDGQLHTNGISDRWTWEMTR